MDSKKIVLSGRDFTSEEIVLVKELADTCRNLSRRELAFTICENISWLRPNGAHKIDSCLVALEKLAKNGIINLPAKRTRTPKKPIVVWTDRTLEEKLFEKNLEDVSPIELRVVVSREDKTLWNEYVDRYHYLKYKKPVGSHLRYFIVSPKLGGKILGCLLFSASSWSVKSRDTFIGWSCEHREKRLHLVINNSRFLIFPWIRIPNLASHVLAHAARQIRTDWEKWFAFSPVLLETFVETSRYTGNCYKAANWRLVGETSGRVRNDRLSKSSKGVKKVFLYPLDPDFSGFLTGEKVFKKKYKKKKPGLRRVKTCVSEPDEEFIHLWKKIINIVSDVADDYDKKWQKRRRVLNSLIIILLIFRLLCSYRKGYSVSISELWDNCAYLGLCLPQKKPVSPSSFSDARAKLNADVFRTINQRIVQTYEPTEKKRYKWKDHRLFAVDGTKVFVPRPLFAAGFQSTSTNRHYPQALVSCLYQLKSQIPVDFEMTSIMDERRCARDHLLSLKPNDVVVYDRGYFSYELLFKHKNIGVHPIFRLSKSINSEFDEFMRSSETDRIITVRPRNEQRRKKLKEMFPETDAVRIRLIKYEIEKTQYCLGTTLCSNDYSIQEFSDAYHSRWGIEELYKISKTIFNVEDFHAQTENGVRQEIFAQFSLITMNRIFSNESENKITEDYQRINREVADQSRWQTNINNCVATVSRNLERLFLVSNFVKTTVETILSSISNSYSKVRTDRKYSRISMQPQKGWRNKKGSHTTIRIENLQEQPT